jgi:hypothetical protein
MQLGALHRLPAGRLELSGRCRASFIEAERLGFAVARTMNNSVGFARGARDGMRRFAAEAMLHLLG